MLADADSNFTKAMNNFPFSVADDAIEHLFQAGESPELPGHVDIKLIDGKVAAASKYTPMNSALLAKPGKKDQPKGGATNQGGASS